MPRAAAAVALLFILSAAQLVDALRGGDLAGSPVLLLGSALAGYLVGVANRWRAAAPAVVVAASALTWSYQLADPGAYPVLDDFVFALLVVGAPSLAGGAVRGRAAQVRELDRLARLLDAQREAEVHAARLEERNRLELSLHRGFSEQVAAIAMRTESAVGAEGEAIRHALAEVEAAARHGLDELREALGTLRESPHASAAGDAAPAPGSSAPQQEPPRRPEAPLGPADLALGVVCGLLMAVEATVSPQAQGPAVLNAAVGMLAGAPLVVRRTRPLSACAATMAGMVALALWLTPPTAMVTAILPVLVCGYSLGAHARGWHRAGGVVLVLAGLAATASVGPPVTQEDEGVVPVLIILALAVMIGTVTAGWTTRAAQRRAAVAELERSREVDVGLAVAEQRNRLASELHDTVAHAMTVICLQASAGQVRPESARVDAILETARGSLELLRTGLDNLGDDHELGLAAISAQATRAGLRPAVSVHGRVDDLRPATTRLAARVVREALTNAGRYAPGSRVRVEVSADEVLRLCVEDEDTEGSAAMGLGAGTGLRGLAEEVERSGGSMSWGRTGDGFHVEVTLPRSEVLV